jgi:hypothetical protein
VTGRNTVAFFRAIPRLVPDAPQVFLEGSPSLDIVALLAPYVQGEYTAPIGTIWSFPQRNERFALRTPPALFEPLAEAAEHHAAPEICDHMHFYRHDEPLANWFDAFDDPLIVSKAIPYERVQQFYAEVGGILSDPAG